MKRAFCLLLILLVVPVAASAQRRMQQRRPLVRHTGSLLIGVQLLDLDVFNNALNNVGRYPEVDETMFTIGAQGMHLRRRFIIGAEGAAAVGPRDDTGDGLYHTRMTGAYGTLNFGYAAVDRNNWLVYPLIGIGAGGIQYSITPTSSSTFNDVLVDPGRSSRMTTASMVVALRAGVQYNFRMRSRRTPMMIGGLSIGLRGGYNFTPLRGTWREMDAAAITNGPDASLAGPQLVLTIGGWRQGRT